MDKEDGIVSTAHNSSRVVGYFITKPSMKRIITEANIPTLTYHGLPHLEYPGYS